MVDREKSPESPPKLAWDTHHLFQLKYFRSLSLLQKLQAVEGMADVVRRLQQVRAEGGFKTALASSAPESGTRGPGTRGR